MYNIFLSFSITSAFFSNANYTYVAGLHSVLNSTLDGRPEPDDIIDDIHSEQETSPDLTHFTTEDMTLR